MSESSIDLHDTTSAQVWAQEWLEASARRLLDRPGEVSTLLDEGWMIGWFANAIETGRSAGERRVVSDDEYTWSYVQAMDRSHKWRVHPADKGRECKACGDGLNDVIRYCPGGANLEVEVKPTQRSLVFPPLEAPLL